jgi:hypothetical protein
VFSEKTCFQSAAEYGLLPGSLPVARGYLGVEDFIGYEDRMAYFTRKWKSDIVPRDNDSVCYDFRCAVGNWWGGEISWTWRGD